MIGKIWKAIGAAAIASVLGFAWAPPPANAADTVLKFLSWQKDEKGYGDWWNAVVKGFEEQHPNVKIEFNKLDSSTMSNTMTTLFAGGQPPDIVHLGVGDFAKFADQGWLEDLGPWIKKSGLDLSKWAGQSKCVWKGKTNCVMMLYFGYVMGYNQTILDALHEKVPANYDDFLRVARAATKDTNGDGIVDQWGTALPLSTAGSGSNFTAALQNFILDTGARWTNDDGRVTIDTPEMVTALSRWKTFVSEGLTPKDLTLGQAEQLMADGKIAVEIDGPWLWSVMQTGAVRPNLKLAMSPFKPPLGGSSNVLAIPADAPAARKQLVWDFITLAMTDKYQALFADLGASPPPSPTADLASAYKSTPNFELLVKAEQAAAAAQIDRVPRGLEAQVQEFAKMVRTEVTRMVVENLDPAEVAKTMQKKAVEIQKS